MAKKVEEMAAGAEQQRNDQKELLQWMTTTMAKGSNGRGEEGGQADKSGGKSGGKSLESGIGR